MNTKLDASRQRFPLISENSALFRSPVTGEQHCLATKPQTDRLRLVGKFVIAGDKNTGLLTPCSTTCGHKLCAGSTTRKYRSKEVVALYQKPVVDRQPWRRAAGRGFSHKIQCSVQISENEEFAIFRVRSRSFMNCVGRGCL